MIAWLCALAFGFYAASPGHAFTLQCQAPDSASSVAHCQVDRGRRLGGLPDQHTEITWTTFTLTSHLCDNTPQGGVRFCHRVTLLGDPPLALPELRTPLAAEVVSQQLRQFLAGGQGPATLAWTAPRPLTETLQTLALALLLAVTAWGLTPRPRATPPPAPDESDPNP